MTACGALWRNGWLFGLWIAGFLHGNNVCSAYRCVWVVPGLTDCACMWDNISVNYTHDTVCCERKQAHGAHTAADRTRFETKKMQQIRLLNLPQIVFM